MFGVVVNTHTERIIVNKTNLPVLQKKRTWFREKKSRTETPHV